MVFNLNGKDYNIVPLNTPKKVEELKFRVYHITGFLLHHYGLHDWKFKGQILEDRIFGECDFNTKTISINKTTFSILDYELLKDIILHEIAHSLVGPNHAHDKIWLAKALDIGCSGQSTCEIIKLIKVDKDKYSATFKQIPNTLTSSHNCRTNISINSSPGLSNPDKREYWQYYSQGGQEGGLYYY
jgi:hypothetical protein